MKDFGRMTRMELFRVAISMRCCATCKHWHFKDIQKYCVKKTGEPVPVWRNSTCDKWEFGLK